MNKRILEFLLLVAACAMLALPSWAIAQTGIPPALITPDRVGSYVGPLEFRDGVASKATAKPGDQK